MQVINQRRLEDARSRKVICVCRPVVSGCWTVGIGFGPNATEILVASSEQEAIKEARRLGLDVATENFFCRGGVKIPQPAR